MVAHGAVSAEDHRYAGRCTEQVQKSFWRQDAVIDQWGGDGGGAVEERGIDFVFAGIQQ